MSATNRRVALSRVRKLARLAKSPKPKPSRNTGPTVVQVASGRWAVTDATGNTISEHETNDLAWRAFDRLANEPINPAEKRSDWIASKILGGSS